MQLAVKRCNWDTCSSCYKDTFVWSKGSQFARHETGSACTSSFQGSQAVMLVLCPAGPAVECILFPAGQQPPL